MEATQTAISVIIPVYNTEQYVARCLDSILSQPVNNIEIICVDDGSTDNSLAVLKAYAQKDSRIIVITQENQGVGAARNRGMEIARGEYIHFVDSDDIVAQNVYEKWYSVAVEQKADVCTGFCVMHNLAEGTHCVYTSGMPSDAYVYSCNLDICKDLVYSGVAQWLKLYSRTFLLKNNLKFSSISDVEDKEFHFHVLKHAQNYVFWREVVYEYFAFRPGAQTAEHRLRHFDCLFECFDRIWKLMEDYDRDIKYRILDNTVEEIFYQFSRAIGTQYENAIYSGIHNFFRRIDVDNYKEELSGKSWYLRYLLFRSIDPNYFGDALAMWDYIRHLERTILSLEADTEKRVREYYENTSCWKITKPIRLAGDFMKKLLTYK